MNYQKMACWGDSQSFGARTYGCFPLYLVQHLNQKTHYTWTSLNLSANGHTARDLWFRLPQELQQLHDTHTACILIGANDVANTTEVDTFTEYYSQCLDALSIAGMKSVHCGEIPPIFPDSHAFFPPDCNERRQNYNTKIHDLVGARSNTHLTTFPELTRDCYVDPVHFNEQGNHIVAEAFATSIIERG